MDVLENEDQSDFWICFNTAQPDTREPSTSSTSLRVSSFAINEENTKFFESKNSKSPFKRIQYLIDYLCLINSDQVESIHDVVSFFNEFTFYK